MKNQLFAITVFIAAFSSELIAQGPKSTQVVQFEIIDLNGNIISSASTNGKVIVLNFWFIGCKPCLKEMPDLNKVYEKYQKNEDVVFASITLDSKEKVFENQKKYNIKYPIIVNGMETSELFNIEGYPTNIVIDRTGNYLLNLTGGFVGIGAVISQSIEKALEIPK